MQEVYHPARTHARQRCPTTPLQVLWQCPHWVLKHCQVLSGSSRERPARMGRPEGEAPPAAVVEVARVLQPPTATPLPAQGLAQWQGVVVEGGARQTGDQHPTPRVDQHHPGPLDPPQQAQCEAPFVQSSQPLWWLPQSFVLCFAPV